MSNVVNLPREWNGTVDDLIHFLQTEKDTIETCVLGLKFKDDDELGPGTTGSVHCDMNLDDLGAIIKHLDGCYNTMHLAAYNMDVEQIDE